MPKILRTGFGRPTGICFYEGHAAAEEVPGPAAAHRRRPARRSAAIT